MIVKLYKNVFKSPPPPERRELFSKLYDAHGVELIGVFVNKDNPLEYYMITKYRDEDHFQSFIATVRELPEYQKMTQRVSDVRISAEAVTLIPE